MSLVNTTTVNMAAIIGSNVRVRLNFDDSCSICESSIYKSFWFLVNLERQKTIESLALELCSRFNISSDLRIELSLDGCILPRWETTAILRDNDLVTVAAVEEAVGKKRSIGNNGERSTTQSEGSRQHQKTKKKKKKRAYEEEEENVLADIVAEPKEKKRRKEVNSLEFVEEDVAAECGGADESLDKERNQQKQDTCTEILDFQYATNSVHSSPAAGAVRSRNSHMIRSEKDLLTNGLLPQQTEEESAEDVVKRKRDPPPSHSFSPPAPFIVASTSSSSAVEESESDFGKNVLISKKVSEAESQLNEVGLDVKDSRDEVKKKSKRTRRSRKNRKEKNLLLLEPELKKSSFNIASPQSLEAPSSSRDVQRRPFQWQNADLPWSKTAAKSHPQHIIFGGDDDRDFNTPNEQNFVIDGVADRPPNHTEAAAAASDAVSGEGLIRNKEPVKDLSGCERKWNCQAVFPYDKQFPQLNETKSNARSLLVLEEAAGEDCASRALSHDQKPRQRPPATGDLSPFSNVQVFKRQRGAKFQSSRSTAEPVLTSKGDPAPKYITRQATEDIPDVKASEIMKDYSVYELLVGPPRPGDVIAYKILQLSDDYSPGLSSYKEAKVQKFVPATRIVELEPKNLQIPGQLKKSTGRFDLTIEDEHEILTNTVMQDDQLISISWDLLLETRLLT